MACTMHVNYDNTELCGIPLPLEKFYRHSVLFLLGPQAADGSNFPRVFRIDSLQPHVNCSAHGNLLSLVARLM